MQDMRSGEKGKLGRTRANRPRRTVTSLSFRADIRAPMHHHGWHYPQASMQSVLSRVADDCVDCVRKDAQYNGNKRLACSPSPLSLRYRTGHHVR